MIDKTEAHSSLVEQLYIWVRERCDASGCRYNISLDHISPEKPPVIYGSVPDVYAIEFKDKKIVIGEAETERGLLDRHTETQLRNFIRGCQDYHNSLFVLAVPWHMTARAKTIIKQLKMELNADHIETVVLEKLGV